MKRSLAHPVATTGTEIVTGPDLRQLDELLARLEGAMAEYLATAANVGVTVTGEAVVAVVDFLLLEAAGRGAEVKFPATVEGFFFGGFYEEMLQQPSNLFELERHADGSEFWVPIDRPVWVAALTRLRETLVAAGNSERRMTLPRRKARKSRASDE